MRLGVNGRFYGTRTSGVQRVAGALVERLCDRAEVTLRIPRGCIVPEDVRRRAEVREGRLRGPAWEQLELPARGRGGALELDPANAGPAWGGRRVLILHDVLPLSHPDAYSRSFRSWFAQVVSRSARRARKVIMFSEWARREAIQHLGLQPERVRVLTQGLEPFHEPAPVERVRATLDRFGLSRPYILATGAGDSRKNAAFLRRVLERLPGGPAGAPTLVLVGAPYRHVHRPDGNAAWGVDVRHLGHVTDQELQALYTAARVFCFPSLAEGFGRPPLEAMGCGTPVVAADYGSAAEVLGEAAVLLPLDAAAWGVTLRELLEDDELRGSRAAAGRAHARRFRWDAAVEGLLEACEDAGGSD